MSKKKTRLLIAKFGEGYQKAMMVLAHSCCLAGFEVIYLHTADPEAIAISALQEDVSHIGITTVPGASVEHFSRLFGAMEKNGISDIKVTAGGIFPPEEVEKIKRMGVLEFYRGSSIYKKIDKWTEEFGETDDTERCADFEQTPKAAR